MEKLSAGAARNLEPGETVCELVQTQTDNGGRQRDRRHGLRVRQRAVRHPVSGQDQGRPHMLVAAERNLYTMTLSGARLLNVGDVVMKLPLDQAQADLSYEKRQLILGGETSTSWGCSASTPTASTPTCAAATASPSRDASRGYSRRSIESPISQNISGQSPTNSAPRSAFPRSS